MDDPVDITALFDTWCRQVWSQGFIHHNRTTAGAAAAMRSGEGFVNIDMQAINTHVTRLGNADQCIEVCAITIDKAASLMNKLTNLCNIGFKHAGGVGIGQHQGCDVSIQICLQLFKVDATISQ